MMVGNNFIVVCIDIIDGFKCFMVVVGDFKISGVGMCIVAELVKRKL